MRYLIAFSIVFLCGMVGFVGGDRLDRILPTDDSFAADCIDPFVSVEVPDGLGSGVVVNSDMHRSFVLTAGHVVLKRYGAKKRQPIIPGWFAAEYPANSIKVIRQEKGVRHEYTVARVRWVEKELDLAVLELTTANLPAVKGVADHVAVGERCWYVGNPGGLRQLSEAAIISAVDFPVQDGMPRTVTGGFGWYGNSGGPMFVKRGGQYHLAGICLSGWPDMPKSPVAFARPEDVKEIVAVFAR